MLTLRVCPMSLVRAAKLHPICRLYCIPHIVSHTILMSKIGSSRVSGDELWKKCDKISSELFVLTYGSLVAQLIKDADGNYISVNQQLDKM